MTNEEKTTCQVCGRTIKAKSGVIAHHGYKRPQWGWQTTSCLGAKYEPYEVSCERLKEVMAEYQRFLENEEQSFQNFQDNPPATMTVQVRRSSWDKEGVETVYQRPDGFKRDSYACCIPRTYENAYESKYYQWQDSIAGLKQQIAMMNHRLNSWAAQPLTQE